MSWSEQAWQDGVVRGQADYLDEDGISQTGAIIQARIMDTRLAMMERVGFPSTAASEGFITTSHVPDAVWWRTCKSLLELHKSRIRSDLAGFYANTEHIATSTWPDFLNANFDGHEVTATVSHTKETITEQTELVADYLDYTPWRYRYSLPNGWPGLKDVYSLFTTAFAVRPMGTIYYYEGIGKSETSWAEATSNADANIILDTHNDAIISQEPHNLTRGTYANGEWTATRRFSKIKIDASQTDIDLASKSILIMRTQAPFYPGSKVYDNNGTGLIEDQFAEYGEYVHVAGEEYDMVWGADTPGDSVNWCADPEAEGDSTSRGYEVSVPLYEFPDFVWVFADFSVTGGFEYKEETEE